MATAGLMLVIFALARTGRARMAPAAVGAYIGAAYWFTSSTSFANPAITVGRMFSNTFAGIAPVSAPVFIGAQIARRRSWPWELIRLLYPGRHPGPGGHRGAPHAPAGGPATAGRTPASTADRAGLH